MSSLDVCAPHRQTSNLKFLLFCKTPHSSQLFNGFISQLNRGPLRMSLFRESHFPFPRLPSVLLCLSRGGAARTACSLPGSTMRHVWNQELGIVKTERVSCASNTCMGSCQPKLCSESRIFRKKFPKINDIIDDPRKDVYGETIGERFLESIKRRKGLLGIQHGCVYGGGCVCSIGLRGRKENSAPF